MLVAAGVFAINLLLWHPVDLIPFRVLLFLLAFFAIQCACVFIHELAHLVAVILFRMLPAALVIGSGPKLAEFTIRQITFRFCSSTNEGCVIPSYGRSPNRFVLVALFAAGPVADIFLLAILAKLLFFPPDALSELPFFESQIQPLLLIAAAYTFFYQVAYLFQRASYRQGRHTDARGIGDALSYVPGPASVQQGFQRLEQQFFKSEGFSEEPLPSDQQDLQTYVKWALSLPRTTPDQAQYLHDLFVTATILYGWSANLPLADAYSRELLSTDPDNITFKGSRGAVLVDLGKLHDGKSLLHEVFIKSESKLDRVISAAFIAIAEHRLGNSEAAEHWLSQALSIDPTSLAVKRVRNELALEPRS